MVGGRVIGLARGPETTLVHVEDRKPGGSRADRCSVRCVEHRADTGERVAIEVGDSIWWQCGYCMWTPAARVGGGGRSGVDYDIRLPKVGYSH